MNLVVHKINKVHGRIRVPGDKSISHRGIILGSMAEGKTVIENYLLSEDIKSLMNCLQSLGVNIEVDNDKLIVKGTGVKGFIQNSHVLNTGNSGTAARLLLGVLSGSHNSYKLDGDPSLRKRPMDRVTIPLKKMGAQFTFLEKEGYFPLIIKGSSLKGIEYELLIASAQVKSSILLASLQAQGRTVIKEPKLTRDHTEIMISQFQGNIRREDDRIEILGGQRLRGTTLYVPGDVSSAAFLIVLATIAFQGELLIENLGLNPTRTGIIDVLHHMNGRIEILSQRIINGELVGDILVRNSQLVGGTIGGKMIPRLIDEIPVLAVAACFAEGKTLIQDAEELKVKESNRIHMMVSQLKKMGACIEATADGMIIEGPVKLKGTRVNSGGDHRIAMALAIAGMVAEGETIIEDAECINVSFLQFENILKTISS